jgi:hypothetical protein
MRILYSIISILFPVLTSAQIIINDDIISRIKAGETALLNARWEETGQIYRDLCEKYNNNPVGYLYLAASIQTEMTAREENKNESEFFGLLDSAKILSEKLLANCPAQDSALCYLFLGHQYAYRAVWEARFGSGLSAISYGFKARGQYRNGLAADSALIDLYLGLGSYHYWKTVKAGILTYTGLFKNDRGRGIDEINLAIDSSLFSQDAARSAMVWVLINEKEYEKAITLSQEMFDRYPEGSFFLWPMAESYYKSKQFLEAAGRYMLLLDRLRKEPGNYFNIIEAVYYLHQCYNRSGDNKKAAEILTYFNSIKEEIPQKTRQSQRRKISFLSRKH